MNRRVAAASLAFVAAGCTWEWMDDLHHRQGTLDVTWTVNGSTTANACAAAAGEDVEIRIRDEWGSPIDVEAIPCAAFGVTFEVHHGWYTVTARLLDANGAQRGVTETLDVLVRRHDTSAVTFDFVAPLVVSSSAGVH